MPKVEDDFVPPHVFVEGDRDEDVSIDIEEIDLQALAEAIYELLKRELILERERRGWHPGR